jgi:hypothetical protein
MGASHGKATTEAPNTVNIAKAARDLIICAADCGGLNPASLGNTGSTTSVSNGSDTTTYICDNRRRPLKRRSVMRGRCPLGVVDLDGGAASFEPTRAGYKIDLGKMKEAAN